MFGGVDPARTSHTPWQASCAIRLRVSIVALPMWGRSVIRGADKSLGLMSGSPSKTSRPAPCSFPASSASTSASSSMTGPTGSVHEHRGRLHEFEFGSADQVTGRIAERYVDADDVGPLQKRSQGRHVTGQTCVVAGMMQHFHVEREPPRWETARAILPNPTRPSVAPWTSRARCVPKPQPCQRPSRRSRSASDVERVAANIKRKARSAVVSSSTPGVLHTAIPREWARATSMLS